MAGMRRPVAVIIGMMGAGKTRVGKEAAQMMQLPFADADNEIEHDAGMKIPEYFERYGEPEFRKLESDVVLDMLEDFDGIFSLGGGAPMTPSIQQGLAEYIADGGKVVYLMADPKEAMERANRGGGRPMLNGDANERWKKLYKERDPVFRRVANVQVRTHGQTPQVAARKLMEMIDQRIVHVTGSTIEPYDVCIGEGVMSQLAQVLGDKPAKVALIHTQPVQRHSDRARTLLRQSGYDVHDIVIPDAEAGKTIEVANGIWQRLGEEGFTRSDAIVGLGGGAATDLAGVLADMGALASLPNDIFIEGLGEVAKSGFIMDPEILRMLEDHADELRSFDGSTFLDSDLKDVVAELIERAVTVKAYHVSADLKEAGLREFLNYGHTLGHAIEKLEHFRWRHGNAVAVGCVYAAELSHLLGYIDQDLVDYHRSLLGSLGLPTSWNNGSWDDVLALMHRDKKARGNKLRFVILGSLGHPIHLEDPPADAVEEAFRRIQR